MSATDKTDPFASLRREVLRLEAMSAQDAGIDISIPGWLDEYRDLCDERDHEFDSLIATPSIDGAIEQMEQQFEETEDA